MSRRKSKAARFDAAPNSPMDWRTRREKLVVAKILAVLA
jgi:hypothetical protein